MLAVFAGSNPMIGKPPEYEVIYRTPQTPSNTCGLDALYVCALFLGRTDLTLGKVEQVLPAGVQGVTVREITSACNELAIRGQIATFDGSQLSTVPVPAILHVQGDHFLAFFGVSNGKVTFFDNTTGLVSGDIDWFTKQFRWQGTAVVLGGPHPILLLRLYRVEALATLLTGFAVLACCWLHNVRARRAAAIIARAGMTLVETLLVVGILVIAMSLLLPAVQKVREAAWRASCQSKLHNIGLGIVHVHDVFGMLPTDGGGPPNSIADAGGGSFTPSESLVYPALSKAFAVGDPTLGPAEQVGSFAFTILPYVGYEAVFRQRSWQTPVPLYLCQQRRSSAALVAPMSDEYGSYVGGGWAWSKTDYACNFNLLRGKGRPRRLADVSDGTSHTIMAGEKAMNPRNYETGTWYMDSPFFFGQSLGTSRGVRSCLVPDGPDFTYIECWGSAHGSAANFVFADGSVRAIPFTTLPSVLKAMETPAGGD
jgi:prepilin-type processing-associated H-X9-DG protein